MPCFLCYFSTQQSFQTDLPDNIQAVARIIERYSTLQSAISGDPSVLTKSVMQAQSADDPGSKSILTSLLTDKAATAMASVISTQDLINDYIRGRAGQTVSTVVIAR